MGFINEKEAVLISSGAIGLLVRDTMLAGTVWRDASADFRGKKNDTISVRLPAYAVANKRTLRANSARVRSTLQERKVDISLNVDLQVDVPLTDEQETLDVRSIVTDVSAPSIGAIVRAIDEEVADTFQGATYETSVGWDSTNPYETLVDAAMALDDASVPANGRFLVLGSELAAQLRKDDLLVQVNTSGSAQTLRKGVIGQVAGFDVLTSAFLDRGVGFAYHSTAVALASRAPVAPQGVAWGSTAVSNGFAIRVMQHLTQDSNQDLLNVVYHDTWIGTNIVTDNGSIDGNGKFVPSVDPEGIDENDLFVRAVKLGELASS